MSKNTVEFGILIFSAEILLNSPSNSHFLFIDDLGFSTKKIILPTNDSFIFSFPVLKLLI